ncbi:MAG: T9SS type A sorting domain-containing protein [Bacteroidota bacterium]
MKHLYASIVALFVSTFVFAQESSWQEMMHDPDAKLVDIQAAFEAYFENKPTGKGTGWKQFKRWEYYQEARLRPDGRLRDPAEFLAEVQRYQESRGSGKRSSASGDWEELGPIYMPGNGTGQPNGLGRIAALEFHPIDGNHIYAGSASGGIWETTDNGTTWNKISNGLVRLGVSSIVVHPTRPDTIYIGTGDRDGGDAPGYGVWRSIDGGQTWNPHNNGMGNRTVYEILMHPGNPDIMIASTNGRIFRTIDGGANWTQSFTGHNCKDIAFKPNDPNIIYASGTRVYRSTNNGATFAQITSGVPTGVQRIALAVSADMPNNVYLLTGNGGGFTGFFRSTNSGLDFFQRSNTPNILGYATNGGTGSQAWYDLVAVGDPNDGNTIYIGGINIWKTTDGGQTWTIVAHWTGGGGAAAIHADQHVLEYSPHNGFLYNGNDGGVYYTANNGGTWPEISSGLGIAQVYKIGQSATTRDLVINGYQDNGTGIFQDGRWMTEIGGDGMECAVDPTDPNYLYGALYYGDIRRSTNGGTSFASIARNGLNGITESGGWVTPYKVDENDPNSMFIGYKNVWRSTNVKAGIPIFTSISAFAGNSNIVDLAIAPSNSNVMYVSRGGTNNFYRTNNALAVTPAWTNLEANLPSGGTPRDIEIDETNPALLWIALGNDIYRSDNSGITWTNISGTLPNITLNTIVLDRNSPNQALYVGMDVGVYYRDNTMTDWVPFDTDLPRVEITELEIFYDGPECDDKLRAATYGRGLWESDLRDPGTLAPQACFAVENTDLCTGSSAKFEDQSNYGPNSWAWSITPGTFIYKNSTTATSSNPVVEFLSPGTYTVSLTVSNGNGNDIETKNNLINVTGTPAVPPISQDMETFVACATRNDCGGTTCALGDGWENMTNGVEDNIDWRTDVGGTPSTGTGPAVDALPGTATGKYLYLEASGCYGQVALLKSPCIDLRALTNASISFSYHMYGSAMGELHFDVLADGDWDLDVMTPITGNQGNQWYNQTVFLNAYAGKVIEVRFRGITGNSYQSDISLDNINIDGSALDTEILTFGGFYRQGSGNVLQWEVGSPDENEVFVLEKFVGDDFIKVAEQQVTSSTTYEEVDVAPFVGVNIYRLQLLGVDGNASYSFVVEVITPELPLSVQAVPNPFGDQVEVRVFSHAAEPVEFTLSDLQGKVYHRQMLRLREHLTRETLSTSALPSGMYLLRIGQQAVKILKD